MPAYDLPYRQATVPTDELEMTQGRADPAVGRADPAPAPDRSTRRADSGHVVCVQTEKKWSARAQAWNELATATDSRSVFLRHEWFEAAWQWLAEQRDEVRVLCVYGDSGLVGICPLVRTRARMFGVPVRKLQFLAIPDTQECDILCRRDDATHVGQLLWDYLGREYRDWDILELTKVGPESNTMRIVSAGNGKSALKTTISEAGSVPGIGLEDGWSAYYARRTQEAQERQQPHCKQVEALGEETRDREDSAHPSLQRCFQEDR